MSKFNETRLKIALGIAALGTLVSVIGWIVYFTSNYDNSVFMGIGFCISVLSYLFGGLLAALKMTVNIATWGFVAAPLPFSIALFLITLVLALLAFCFLPIIPVYRTVKEHGMFR